MENKKHCNICNKDVSSTNWSKHLKTKMHMNLLVPQKSCNICNVVVPEPEWIQHLKSSTHKNNTQLFLQKLKEKLPKKTNKRTFQKIELENDKYKIEETDQALEGCFLTIRLTPQEEIASVQVFIEELPETLVSKLENVLKQKKGFKLQVVLTGIFKKFHPATGTEEFDELPVPSKNRIILREDEIKTTVEDLLNKIHEKIESWDNNEGYWHLINVIHVDLKIREYKPLSGSSYIKTPKWISDKKATTNIKNEDQKCFKYCMLYHKYKKEIKWNPERLYHYKKWENSKEFNFDGIKFPVEVNDLKKFCKQNDISLNLYITSEKEIIPHLTCAKDERKPDHVNLLLLKDEEKSHYIYVNDLSRLVRDQITKMEHHFMICERCFYHTNNEEVFRQHQELCDHYLQHGTAIPILPSNSDKIIKFKNLSKSIRAPLVYYADLEAILRKLNHKKLRARHEACAYSFYTVSSKKFYNSFKIYTGKSAKDTMNHFVQTLNEEGRNLSQILMERLEKFKNHDLSLEEEKEFQDSNECHICKKKFSEIDIKVRDHCHITGKFRGAAHQSCNLKVRTSLKIPVFFHNGSGYDFKHFIRKLYKIDKNLRVLSQTEEKYFSISVNVAETNITFVFKDSLRFLLKSLINQQQYCTKRIVEV
jgi:hypothetical protein